MLMNVFKMNICLYIYVYEYMYILITNFFLKSLFVHTQKYFREILDVLVSDIIANLTEKFFEVPSFLVIGRRISLLFPSRLLRCCGKNGIPFLWNRNNI